MGAVTHAPCHTTVRTGPYTAVRDVYANTARTTTKDYERESRHRKPLISSLPRIRRFDCRELSSAVRGLVQQRQWWSAQSADARMVHWAWSDYANVWMPAIRES